MLPKEILVPQTARWQVSIVSSCPESLLGKPLGPTNWRQGVREIHSEEKKTESAMGHETDLRQVLHGHGTEHKLFNSMTVVLW